MDRIFHSATEIKNILTLGKTFTLIGGCFDLIHAGHIHLFEYASSLEDLLVVAVLSDNYIKKYKESDRPIINERQRAKMVASIRYVDFVYIAETSPNSYETLFLLKPNSVVFGNEKSNTEKIQQRMETITESSPNTKTHLFPRYKAEEISTSYIIKKIIDSRIGLFMN